MLLGSPPQISGREPKKLVIVLLLVLPRLARRSFQENDLVDIIEARGLVTLLENSIFRVLFFSLLVRRTPFMIQNPAGLVWP